MIKPRLCPLHHLAQHLDAGGSPQQSSSLTAPLTSVIIFTHHGLLSSQQGSNGRGACTWEIFQKPIIRFSHQKPLRISFDHKGPPGPEASCSTYTILIASLERFHSRNTNNAWGGIISPMGHQDLAGLCLPESRQAPAHSQIHQQRPWQAP